MLYFSATIITLDGSATTSDGEPCESGTGYTEQSGWWDSDRSYWRVHDQRANVRPDRYPAGGHRSPARWLADRLLARLGAVASWEPTGTSTAPAKRSTQADWPAPDRTLPALCWAPAPCSATRSPAAGYATAPPEPARSSPPATPTASPTPS